MIDRDSDPLPRNDPELHVISGASDGPNRAEQMKGALDDQQSQEMLSSLLEHLQSPPHNLSGDQANEVIYRLIFRYRKQYGQA